MQTHDFYVEKTGTGYSAYSETLGVAAVGKTLKALYKDAHDGLETQCDVTGENLADFELTFSYDLPSLVDVTRLNVDALSELTGMNPSLMSQYINRKKVPGPKQKARIEAGIHAYAQKLTNFKFA